MIKPFLKWCGGKRQLLPIIRQYVPKEYNTYYEPFVGAGAVLFDLQPKKAIINDLNEELIDCYMSVRDNIEEVITYLKLFKDTKEYYYSIRELDRNPSMDMLNCSFRAARTIYLNKTGFNGIYRVNKSGYFNIPYGKHEPYEPDIETIKAVSQYLKNNNVLIHSVDFEIAVEHTKAKDFIYLDSPYDTISDTANFTSYTKEGFTKDDQIRLRDCFKRMSDKDCYCMLSNAGTDFIKDLYKDFNIVDIEATRMLNCKGDKRGKVSEVLIMNYNNQIST
jgi:DNA adenine methylase